MKPEFKLLLDQIPLGRSLGVSKWWILVKVVDIFVNALSFLSQLWFSWPKPNGQGDLRLRAIGNFLYLKTLYRLYKSCKKKKRKKYIIYYLNSIQHSKFVTPGALYHMCSPFNHLNDFVNYGPLPASFVQSKLTLASW